MDDCYFRSDLFHATRQRAVHDRHWCHTRPCPMVCARTRGAMPAPRILHRRSHCCIRQPGSGTQILRGKRQEMVILHDSRHLRWNLSRLFLHDTTVIYKHIQARSRARPCHCFPLFRPGDQYFINYPNGSHLGRGNGNCPHSWSHHIFHCHRSSHVIHFP